MIAGSLVTHVVGAGIIPGNHTAHSLPVMAAAISDLTDTGLPAEAIAATLATSSIQGVTHHHDTMQQIQSAAHAPLANMSYSQKLAAESLPPKQPPSGRSK